MDKFLEYEFSGTGIEKYEDSIERLVADWLKKENGIDVLVTALFFGDYGSLIIDYSFEKRKGKNIISKLAEQLFLKLHITNYKLQTN